MNALLAHLRYYGKAAAHTFWQGAAASLAAEFAGGSLDMAHLQQVPYLEKVGGAAAVAGAAAVLSYVKALLVLPAPGQAPAIEQ